MTLREIEEKLKLAQAELTSLRSRSKDLLESWANMGFSGMPDEAAIEEKHRANEEMQSAIAGAERRRQLLWDGWRKWESMETLQLLQREIEQLRDSRDEEQQSTVLLQRLQSAREERERIARAREEAERVRNELARRNAQYRSQVLSPLKTLVESYFRAISIFPEWELKINTSERRKKTLVDMTVHPTQKAAAKLASQYSAAHLLSEGQLSAVALSQLLAMSTAYRWSRWRALLLDDPLQHNDVIHAAAFIDLIRNLVREERYQFVISTHDLGIAGFFRRKLRAEGVPCTTCYFSGMGTDGLITTVE